MKTSIFYIIILLLLATTGYSQYINRDGYTIWTGRMGVGIPATGLPNAYTHLQLGDSASLKSLLLPRVNGNSSIVSPKSGMFHYNVVNQKLYYRKDAGWFPLVDSSQITSLINVGNGTKYVGDTIQLGGQVYKFTYIHVPSSQNEGDIFAHLRFGNLPKTSSPFSASIPDYNQIATYNPSTLSVERYFSEARHDTDYLQYGAGIDVVTRHDFDSFPSKYGAGLKDIILPSQGYEALYQINPPRDSTRWQIKRDGQQSSVFVGQHDIGQTWGYNLNVYSESVIPDMPISTYKANLDFRRNIDNNRRYKMIGNGVAQYLSAFKAYQNTITGSTVETGSYISRVIGFDAYGTMYPLGNTNTKAKALLVSTVDTVAGFWAHPQYRYTNDVKNGYGFVSMGDSDYNYMAGFLRVRGNSLPTRQNSGQNFLHAVEVTGDVAASDTVVGFLTGGQGLFAKIDRAIGNEAGVNFSMKDSVQAGNISAFLPDNRDSRYLYMRMEGFSAAAYPDNSLGMYIRFETGANHNNVSRISRNGNWTFGNGATALGYRWYKKATFDGSIAVMDTLTIKNIPTGAAAGDSSNYKPLVINSNGDVFKGAWVGGGGGGTVTNVATGFGLSGGPITTFGTISGDTTVGTGLIAYPRYLKFKDSVNAIFTPMARALTAGYGLTGGGDLSANRTFTVDSTSGGLQTYLRGIKIVDSMVAVNNLRYWSLIGNSATSGSQSGSFLGSTNSVPIRFRTNNTQRMYLDSARAQLIIGTPTINANDALIIQSVGSGNYDGFRIFTSNLANSASYSASGIQHAGGYDINTSSSGISLSPNTGVIIGTAFGTATSLLHINGSTTSRAQLRLISTGSLPTTTNILAGNIDAISDKIYFTIATGPTQKEFTLNDASLTSGRVPYTTTNGRLIDASTLTFNGTNLSLGGAITSYLAYQIASSITGTAGAPAAMFATGGTITEAGSGNHSVIGAVYLSAPTITGAAATVTKTATLYIDGAPSTTVTDRNYALYINSGEVYYNHAESHAIAGLSATQTLDNTFYTVRADATGGSFTLTLPAAAGCLGRIYIIKKIDASINTVTIDGNASETIDGATTKVLLLQYAGSKIQSNGTNWDIIGSF